MRAPRLVTTIVSAAGGLAVAATGAAQSPSTVAGSTTAPIPPLVVQTSLTPTPTFFGDQVTAVVTVDVDTRAVNPGSVQVAPTFDPYVETGLPSMTRSSAGAEVTEFFRYTIQCLTDGCLPPAGSSKQLQLPPVAVTALAGVRRLRASGQWPQMTVSSRLTRSGAGGPARFRAPSSMPAPAYNVSPSALSWVLIILAAVLAASALLIAGLEVGRIRARSPRRQALALTPLQAALRYTRQAAHRTEPADRRRAIGLLSATLAEEGHQTLADSAGGVAWSEAPPSAASTETLADEVEANLGSEAS